MNKPTLEDINKHFSKIGYNIKVSSIDDYPCFVSKWNVNYKIYVENQSEDITDCVINQIWKIDHFSQYNNELLVSMWDGRFELRFIH